MLVLTRKRNQGIVIQTSDGPIMIMILDIQRERTKVGIEAPKSCVILRDELLRREEEDASQ